jgi:hypothetical protein
VTTAAASLHRFPSYWWATTLIVVIALGYPTSVVLLARAAARGWSGRLDVGRLVAVSLWCLIPAVLGVVALLGQGAHLAQVLGGSDHLGRGEGSSHIGRLADRARDCGEWSYLAGR